MESYFTQFLADSYFAFVYIRFRLGDYNGHIYNEIMTTRNKEQQAMLASNQAREKMPRISKVGIAFHFIVCHSNCFRSCNRTTKMLNKQKESGTTRKGQSTKWQHLRRRLSILEITSHQMMRMPTMSSSKEVRSTRLMRTKTIPMESLHSNGRRAATTTLLLPIGYPAGHGKLLKKAVWAYHITGTTTPHYLGHATFSSGLLVEG